MGRFPEPLALVPIDDPVGLAWAEFFYNDNEQPLIDLGIFPAEDEKEEEKADTEVEVANLLTILPSQSSASSRQLLRDRRRSQAQQP